MKMPKMLYGTAWKQNRTTDLVYESLKLGFRGIDTACQPKHYNEKGVGDAIKAAMINKEDGGLGIKREELFIQTKFTSLDGQDPNKVPYDKNVSLNEQVKQSLKQSLNNLGISYIDSLVLHGPMRNHSDNMEVWRTIEGFVDEGLVKQLGVSNFYKLSELRNLYESARIKPLVVQNRFYEETGYDKSIRQYCNETGMTYQSFWTLTGNPHILKHPNIIKMSNQRNKTPAQLFFSFLIQCGICPLTGCTSTQHMIDDIEAMTTIHLTSEETIQFQLLVDPQS